MKPNASMITMTILFCILIIGCGQSVEQGADTHLVNSRLINSYNDTAIENAIISQHTLFGYHFVQNGAELNELGQRDLAVLAGHFAKHPGRLNIRRHNVPAELYEARVNLVREGLQKAGIELERMSISDGMPGGSGMASERVLIILEEESQGASLGTATTSMSTSGAMR